MTEGDIELSWSPDTVKCKCGHLGDTTTHPAKAVTVKIDGVPTTVVRHPCGVLICDCADLEIDPTGKAKPR